MTDQPNSDGTRPETEQDKRDRETRHYVAGQQLPDWMPPAPPARPTKKGMNPGSVFALIVIGALVVGGAIFGGYTLLHNNAEKTACQQLADDNVHYVNPSHAWDLYQVYMAASSGSTAEHNAVSELNSFCADRGVSLLSASWQPSYSSSSSSSSSHGSSSAPTTQPTYGGGGGSSHPTFSVTQGTDYASQQMAATVTADPRYWLDDSGNTSSLMTSSAVCAPSSNPSWQFNCNITFNNGGYGSYWTSWSSSSAGYQAVRRTS
jgi:hypothetical protein